MRSRLLLALTCDTRKTQAQIRDCHLGGHVMTPEMDPPGEGQKTSYHHDGQNAPQQSRHDEEVLGKKSVNAYWQANLRLLGILLSIWFFVAFGLSIFLVDVLNTIPFFGFKLGFWWAQQGSIYVFIGLVFYYVYAMKRLDKAFGVDDDV